jgi:hypothetical protein
VLAGRDSFDKSTQQDFEHRRQWVIDRLTEIDAVFCIDICAYAVVSNHYHLVLYINKKEIDGLTDLEVIERWRKLYNGPEIIQRYLRGGVLSPSHHLLIKQTLEQWRERLTDISWYMRCLDEFIARKANFEDKCKGRFYSLPSMVLTLWASNAVQLYPSKLVGKGALKAKPYWMSKHC